MYKIKTPPARNPIETYAVKEFLRLTDNQEDYILEDIIIPSVVKVFEDLTGKAFITQTILDYFDNFNSDLCLSRSNIQSVVSVKYTDTNNVVNTLINTDYYINGLIVPAKLIAKNTFPSTNEAPNNVEVEYIAGYGDLPSSLDPAIKLVLLQCISVCWQQRGILTYSNQQEMSFALKYLIEPYRSLYI